MKPEMWRGLLFQFLLHLGLWGHASFGEVEAVVSSRTGSRFRLGRGGGGGGVRALRGVLRGGGGGSGTGAKTQTRDSKKKAGTGAKANAALKLPKGQHLVGPPPGEVYDGPFKANAQNVWNYHDHGVSWAKGKCSSAKDQSPIELPATATAGLEIDDATKLYYRYQRWETPVKLYNDGLSLGITFNECVGGFGTGPEYLEGGGLEIKESFALFQINFHSPSEHLWGGEHVALEVQLVHRKTGDPNQLGIISIPFQQGLGNAEDHPFLTALLEVPVPEIQFVESLVNAHQPHALDFKELIGENSTYYVYDGSVTVPDCETNAKWFVQKERNLANPRQVEQFVNAIYQMTDGTGNNRVVQKLQDRKVRAITAHNAEALPTIEELFASEPAPALNKLKPEQMDADHEDSVVAAPRPEPETPDEHEVKEAKIKATYNSRVPEEIRKAWSDKVLEEDPERIIDADPGVITTGQAVEAAKAKYDEAALMAEEACKGLEEAAEKISEGGPGQTTNQKLANAQFKGCETAKKVAETEHDGMIQELANYNSAFGAASAGVYEAQRYSKIDKEVAFNQTQLPKHERTMQPIPEGAVDTTYPVPHGDVLNPFNLGCAETTTRINPQHPFFAEHVGANMRQPSIPGANTIEAEPLGSDAVPEFF